MMLTDDCGHACLKACDKTPHGHNMKQHKKLDIHHRGSFKSCS